jgi:hypothetical protein
MRNEGTLSTERVLMPPSREIRGRARRCGHGDRAITLNGQSQSDNGHYYLSWLSFRLTAHAGWDIGRLCTHRLLAELGADISKMVVRVSFGSVSMQL